VRDKEGYGEETELSEVFKEVYFGGWGGEVKRLNLVTVVACRLSIPCLLNKYQ
jgi:hypothetical protein